MPKPKEPHFPAADPNSSTWDELAVSNIRPQSPFEQAGMGEKRARVSENLLAIYGQDGLPSQLVTSFILKDKIQAQVQPNEPVLFSQQERYYFMRPAANRLIFRPWAFGWLNSLSDVEGKPPRKAPVHMLGQSPDQHYVFLDHLKLLEPLETAAFPELQKIEAPGRHFQSIDLEKLLTVITLELDLSQKLVSSFLVNCPVEYRPHFNRLPTAKLENWAPSSQTIGDKFPDFSKHWQERFATYLGENILTCGDLLDLTRVSLPTFSPLIDQKSLSKWRKLNEFGPKSAQHFV